MKRHYFLFSSLLFSIYLFLVGVNCLSQAFTLISNPIALLLLQKVTNPLVGFFFGIFATAIMQSSSATNAIAITMVSTELISLQTFIPIIMGSNIGTTVTNSIVALGTFRDPEKFKRAFAASTIHDFFNMLTALILLPLECYFHIIEKVSLYLYLLFLNHKQQLTTPFENPIAKTVRYSTDLIHSFFVHYPTLYLIVSIMLILTTLSYIVTILKRGFLEQIKSIINTYLFNSPLKSWSFGALFTSIVQSSSITTSLVIPFASQGAITLRQIYPYTVGANFGTGFTTFLAAISLNYIAFIAAIATFLFDVIGSVFIYPVPIIGDIPIWCAKGIANYSYKYRFIPLLYLVSIFIILPLVIIFI